MSRKRKRKSAEQKGPTRILAALQSSPAQWVMPMLVVLAGWCAYHNSFSGAFVFDDEDNIVNNLRIRSAWPDKLLAHARPVVEFSLALNYESDELENEKPKIEAYHRFNLIIHLLAAVTLFGLVRRTLLLERFREEHSKDAAWIALAIATLWVVHPLTTQGVTYIIQRAESMMAMFFLVCLYCVLRGSQSSRPWPWYVGAALACWLGMGSKQVMVVAPIVALLFDRTFLAGSFKETFRRRWGLYVGFLPAWLWIGIFYLPQASSSSTSTAGFLTESVTMFEYARSQPGVILHYLRLSFWPHPLCLDYMWPVADTIAGVLLPGIVIFGLVAASFWALRRWPAAGFLGVSFFLILAPTSSIMPIKDLAFEHRMYLPLTIVVVLVTLGAGALLQRVFRRLNWSDRRQAVFQVSLLFVVALVLCLRTIDRNEDYRSVESIWRNTVKVCPENHRAHVNLGRALEDLGRALGNLYQLDQAIEHYRKALELEPNDADAHIGWGRILAQKNELDEALEHFQEARRIAPKFARAHNNVGLIYFQKKQWNDAKECFQKAVKVDSNPFKALFYLGRIQEKQSNIDKAEDYYLKALDVWPRYPQAHNKLGVILMLRAERDKSISEMDKAIWHCRESLKYSGYLGDSDRIANNAQAHRNLGSMLLEKGQFDEARINLLKAVQLNPKDVVIKALIPKLTSHPDPRLQNLGKALQQALQQFVQP